MINNGSLQQLQRTTLIIAINQYFASVLNKRFINLREMKIAKNLMHSLRQNPANNALQIVKNHFKKNTMAPKNSLNHFLLSSIAENNLIFLIPNELNAIETKMQQNALINNFIHQEIYTGSQYAYLVGKCFEADGQDVIASHYYAIAVLSHHQEALDSLQALAEKGIPVANYLLAIYYYHQNGQVLRAIDICLSLEYRENHVQAYKYLNETEFTSEQFIYIAEQYIKGEIIEKNISKAIDFYQHSAELNDKNAILVLAQAYDPFCENVGIQKYPRLAFEYYLKLDLDNEQFSSLSKLVHYKEDETLKFNYAVLAIEKFELVNQGLIILKQLVEKNHTLAKEKLNSLVYKEAKYAFELGKIYEDDNVNQAYQYYILSLEQGYKPAVKQFKSLSKDGDSQAQFILAKHFYFREKSYKKAIDLILQSIDAGNQLAIEFMEQTKFGKEEYFYIAQQYLKVQSIKCSIKKAVEYYKKAADLNEQKSIKALANIYDPFCQNVGIEKNAQRAIDYYLKLNFGKEELSALFRLARVQNDNELLFDCAKLAIEKFKRVPIGLSSLKKLSSEGHVSARNYFNDLLSRDIKYIYALGKIYEKEKNREKAYQYYIKALQQNHIPTIKYVKKLAENGDHEAKYLLAQYYYNSNNQHKEAITICLELAQRGHKQALRYIDYTNFSKEDFFFIAQQYASGKIIKKDILRTIVFCERAAELNHQEAIRFLAQIFDPYYEDFGCDKDANLAFDYYLKLNIGEPELQSLLNLAHYQEDKALLFKCAEIEIEQFNHVKSGLKKLIDLSQNNYRNAKEKINDLIIQNVEYAHVLGTLYEKEDAAQMYQCYIYALEKQYQPTIIRLKQLAQASDAQAKYLLAKYYYHQKGKYHAAIVLCFQSYQAGYQLALDYINNTNFTKELYVYIAEHYLQGEIVERDITKALGFYERAAKLNDQLSIKKLAHIYDPYDQDFGVAKNKQLAIAYYQQSDIGELEFTSLLRLARESADTSLLFYCAVLAIDKFNNTSEGLQILKNLSEIGYKAAQEKIQTLLASDIRYVYELGVLYEKESREKAYEYYIKGLENNDSQTIMRMHDLAQSGLDVAQHLLAKHYYYRNNNYQKAMELWVSSAAQGNCEAHGYLANAYFPSAICLQLAKIFEQGERLKQDVLIAINLYKKVINQDKKDIAFKIAQLSDSINAEPEVIFDYYLMAANNGHKKAIAALKRLANEVDTNCQLKISYFFRNDNSKKSKDWATKAEEAKQFRFKF